MSASIVIVGEGLLANYAYERLSVYYDIKQQDNFQTDIDRGTDLLLVIHDMWNPVYHKQAENTRIPWLRAFISFGEGIIGPFVQPNIKGCSQCADSRLLLAGNDSKEMLEVQKRLVMAKTNHHDTWASHNGVLQMLHFLIEEVHEILCFRRSRLTEHIYTINLETLASSHHFFLPHPLCPVCSQIPDDSSELARILLQPSPKVHKDAYRTRSMSELQSVLAKDYLDNKTGLLNDKMYNLTPPFADVTVNLPLLFGNEGTAGRTLSYEESELTAILEGLERYNGIQAISKRTIVHDNFRNLNDVALNPLTVGVHAPDEYEKENFPFQRFDSERKMNWVWGYSLLQERSLLVPELLAYYSLSHDGFVYETSNGCAMGGSVEEAILHGIFEVIERDSFLLTWYARLPLPRLDLSSVHDVELQLMMQRMEAVGGYELHAFQATMEHSIPSIWIIAKNKKETGMNLLCAAGSHLDPIRAVKGALFELAGMMLTLDEKLEKNQGKYKKMLSNPFLVKEMDHHSMLYGLPEAEERLDFLLKNEGTALTFNEAFGETKRHADIKDDLQYVLQTLKQKNFDVIVVNQTSPEIKRNGLHCVKVIIPGMLPMTFGYHLTRLTGLERVLRIPMELGYRKTPLTYEQLNPHPHPFP
ncbi:TOMM precursor leader peptide-binding protein [Bacillus sp. RG28]|uniref:TOMM leader peptide-binding protein n=1 Tax=Gottfriedia endophytica TaxID=2820819 RepID=A0A940SHX2_9BACI|nr:TOMM precursor leader peptide-binding protein [Gottfriedia endophytica]MBP0726647.1 TOMM precursor leader peptide-binding protein [Gottfriedia endophytica]